jgi:hypothetical protein
MASGARFLAKGGMGAVRECPISTFNGGAKRRAGTESIMIDILLWGGVTILIVGLAIIATRKPTV